ICGALGLCLLAVRIAVGFQTSPLPAIAFVASGGGAGVGWRDGIAVHEIAGTFSHRPWSAPKSNPVSVGWTAAAVAIGWRCGLLRRCSGGGQLVWDAGLVNRHTLVPRTCL